MYRELLSRFTVWDYSRRNLTAISSLADHHDVHLVPVGYMPQLTRIPAAPSEDIDVLFYGSVNQRRHAVLSALEQAGLRVMVETRAQGAVRDALISRAKVVLNLHFYPSAIFEIVRVSYLLANRKAVVGECGPQTEIDPDIRDAIAPAPYDHLCDRVFELLRDNNGRFALARRGHNIFAKRDLPEILTRAIAETETKSRDAAPKISNLGTPGLSTSNSQGVDRYPTTGRDRRMKRILFHAINGNGLGHLVRLSVLAHSLQDRAEVAIFSSCPFAGEYWPGQLFSVSDRLDDRFELSSEQRNRLGFHLALNKFVPDVIVFDTHWPHTMMDRLREKSVRTVLVLRTMLAEKMEEALRCAARDFSSVLIPHHPAEVERTYGPDIIGLMNIAPCVYIGPVARTTCNRDYKRKVIFTLGGGGEYWHWTPSRSVDTFIDVYRRAASALTEKLGIEPIFAAGPLLNRADEMLSPFQVIRSHKLHEMFGPDTIVVTRGGYNTCWEAVAAGSRLIIVGDIAHGVEDIATRGRFLESEGLAKAAQADALEIVAACNDLLERPALAGDHYFRRSVNSGLSIASDEILGL